MTTRFEQKLNKILKLVTEDDWDDDDIIDGFSDMKQIESDLNDLRDKLQFNQRIKWVNKEAWRRLRDAIDEFHHIFASLKKSSPGERMQTEEYEYDPHRYKNKKRPKHVDPDTGHPAEFDIDASSDSVNASHKQRQIDVIKWTLDSLEGNTRELYTKYMRADHPNAALVFKMIKQQRVMDDALTDMEEMFQSAHGDGEDLLW